MGSYQHERGEAKWKTYKGPPPTMPPYAPAYGEMARDYLKFRRLDDKLARINGWYPAFTDTARIVIPSINSAGTPYYQARRMDGSPVIRYDSPVAPRGDSVVVIHPYAKGARMQVMVMEGPMDALCAAMFGYVGIAVMGNNPAEEAFDFIVAKFSATHAPFIIVPDMDDNLFGAKLVGRFATRGVAARLALPTAKDLCELTDTQRNLFFKKLKGIK